MDDLISGDSQNARIDALSAFVTALEEGTDRGIAELGNLEDPIRLSSALSLLIQDKRFSDAADIVRNRKLDCKWLHLAVYALVANNEIEIAIERLKLAGRTCNTMDCQRGRIAFAESALTELLDVDPREGLATRRPLSEADRKTIAKLIDVLDPIIGKIRVLQRIEHETEHLAVTFAARAFGLLGRLDEIADLVAPLTLHKPVPLLLAQLSLLRVCAPPDDLPGRLRVEHPTSFSAQLFAALLERDVFGREKNALTALCRLVSLVEEEGIESKDVLCKVLFETAAAIGTLALDDACQIVEKVAGEGNSYELYFAAAKSLRDGNTEKALQLLHDDERDNDPVWWQLKAKSHEKDGDTELASDAWKHACDLMPHPDLLLRFASLSIDQRRFEAAANSLEMAREQAPDDLDVLHQLGLAYVNSRAYPNAVSVFQDLVRLQPNEPSHRLNLALCLIRSNRSNEVQDVLKPISCPGDELVEAVGIQCQVMIADGKAQDALQMLNELKERHWHAPEFVALFMRTAYAAGDDRSANDALRQILQLQERGDIDRAILQPKSLDDLIDFGIQRQQQRDMLMDQIRHGKLPWLFAEELFGIPAFRAWMTRTQDLLWASDEPIARAESTIYATNGFSVFLDDHGKEHFQRVIAAPAGVDIVADLSALITLHQINKLDVVVQRYAKIILPISFGDLRVHDGDRLAAHQPARERELRRIRDAIDEGRITILQDSASDDSIATLVLDEHAAPEAQVLRLHNLYRALFDSQKLNSSEYAELKHYCGREPLPNHDLELPIQITVGLSTLRLLTELSCFDKIILSFQPALTREDYDDLVSELHAYQSRHEAHQMHMGFWDHLAELSNRIEYCSASAVTDFFQDEGTSIDRPPYFDAALLAEELSKPLLTDDRVCQAFVFRRPHVEHYSAFGTDAVLSALGTEGVLHWADIANDYLTLMRWRYRFLVADPMILKEIADRSKPNLPGPELRKIAAYVHESLRDPGLFCGPEKIEPPLPMAYQLFTAWNDASVQFLRLVWNDSLYDDEQAAIVTRWAVANLIPSTPKGLLYQPLGKRMAKMIPRIVLMSAMLQFATIQPLERANAALRLIGQELGMSDREFFTAASEVADARYD